MLIVTLAPQVQWGIDLAYCSGFLPWYSPLGPQVTGKCKTGGDVTDFPREDVISIV